MIFFSRQAFFSFVLRFNITHVEYFAGSVYRFLKVKQKEKQSPKAHKEVHDKICRLQKLEKSIEKQKTL